MTPRRLAAWAIAIPLMGAGSQIAHVFAYRLVYPESRLRVQELLATGHGYLAYMPLVLGFGAAVELAAFASILVGTIRRRRYPAVRPWTFALLPPLGFALQELLERWFAGASFPWWAVEQPTFRIGLLLQLPFALAAYLTARLLLRVAHGVGLALRRDVDRRRAGPPALAARLADDAARPRLAVLAAGYAGRAPPISAAAAI